MSGVFGEGDGGTGEVKTEIRQAARKRRKQQATNSVPLAYRDEQSYAARFRQLVKAGEMERTK